MNRIVFSNLGGFPIEQDTLKFMQEGDADMVAALAALLGEKVVVSGVVVAGGNVSGGWIVYNGELIKFIGGAVGAQVVITETTQDALFEDGSVYPVYKTRTATCGAVGAFPFADLVRLNSIHALIKAFNLHTHSYDALTELPVAKAVFKDSINIGDINPVDKTVTVAHGQNIDPANYYVVGTMWGNDLNYNQSNDLSWILYDKQNDSFKIGLRDLGLVVQNLRFEFIIFKF